MINVKLMNKLYYFLGTYQYPICFRLNFIRILGNTLYYDGPSKSVFDPKQSLIM